MRSVAFLLPLLLPLAAFAGLGDKATTAIPGDSTAGAAVVRRAVPARSYTIQDIQARGGVAVREYVTADGRVFAVAWSGPVMPDLVELLSAYFPPYREEVQKRGPSRAPVVIRRDDLVVESGGHMRSFRGRAYLPGMLPTDMSIDEIR
ncbi:MAG: DUF2844 domain-containing protein [Rhodocyclales bacterium]|nr:DUF2844 domain-containing protein [Rhodocyclales bacterium]